MSGQTRKKQMLPDDHEEVVAWLESREQLTYEDRGLVLALGLAELQGGANLPPAFVGLTVLLRGVVLCLGGGVLEQRAAVSPREGRHSEGSLVIANHSEGVSPREGRHSDRRIPTLSNHSGTWPHVTAS